MLKTKKILFLYFILSLSIFSQIKLDESQLKSFLDNKEIIYEDICVQMGVANWNVYSQEETPDQDTPKGRYSILFSNDSLHQVINYWYPQRSNLRDKVLQRRVEVWYHILIGAKVDMEPEVFELENQLEEWLSGQVPKEEIPPTEELNNMVLHLMKLRNEKAQKLGYENYAVMMLELTELGNDWFMEQVDLILKRTKPQMDLIYDELRIQLKKETLTFFDLLGPIREYYFGSDTPITPKEDETMFELMKKILANIGINYEELPIRFVEREVPYGGNGLAISVPDDFRVIRNVGMPLSVWMHELGHGLQAMFTQIEYPILKGYEWCLGEGCPAFSEGMAETSARFSRNNEVIKSFSNLEDYNKDLVLNKYSALYLRFSLISALFEIEFYKDLSQNPGDLLNNLYEEILSIENPAGRDYNISENIIYVSYPVYLHNYLLADIISWQVHNSMEEKFGKNYPFNKETSSYLIDHFYRDGEFVTWREKLINGTGKALDIDGYLKSFGY
ncbi:MAG: hypothetical protein JW866_03480 [Ignavibacteriales bacterium]|nr:hypothetical protein [Ignavibacteriales bacterium]